MSIRDLLIPQALKRGARLGVLAAVVVAAYGPWAAPRVEFSQRRRVALTVRPLAASLPAPTAHQLELDPQGRGSLDFGVAWPEPGAPSRVHIEATERSRPDDDPAIVALEVELRLADGRTFRSRREIACREPSTVLFEVFREADRSLTLAVVPRTFMETVVEASRTVGLPVRFHLAVERVLAGRSIPLETNRLQTFVGDPVTYAFRLGSTPESDAVNLRLKPLRRSGDLIEISVEISGRLPDGEELNVMARKEQWIASRGAPTVFAFESGEPPTGYRFVVTAEY